VRYKDIYPIRETHEIGLHQVSVKKIRLFEPGIIRASFGFLARADAGQ
jgi:hypothetical protein